jgi:elongation factor G
MRVAPTERGSGSEFVDSIVGGAIPRNFLPAVQKGTEETMATGGVLGFPVVDVRVECYDGKYHSVDSSDMAFRTAASLGLKEALGKASPVVLEPVSLLTVNVPESMQGDVLGDINSRRGRVSGSNPLGDGHIEITAMVPAAEIARYAVDLRSMTGGRGSFHAVYDHYDVLPAHLTSRLLAEKSKAS